MDEEVAQFTAFTSAEPAKAVQYLQLTDGNLEQAIQLYFENPDLDLGATSPQASRSAPPAPPADRPTHYEDEQGVIHVDSDEEEEDPFPTESIIQPTALPDSDFEDDEAMARRLQNEMYAGEGEGVDVRAPIARTAETLVGPGADYNDEADMNAAMIAHERAREARRRLGANLHFLTLS